MQNIFQVWIVSCIGFVFIAILEYFAILVRERFTRKGRDKSSSGEEGGGSKCHKIAIFPRIGSAKYIRKKITKACQ